MDQKSRKQAALPPDQASQELYRALFEQATDGIFIADEQGQYVEVNQRGCEMLSYSREELLGLSMKDLIPAEDLSQDPLRLRVLQEGGSLLRERRLRCKDGSLLPVEISAWMLTDGRFLGIVRDISKRKQAEERLQLAVDAAQMGQWDWNIATGEAVWSEKCLALYGLPPDTEMSRERFLEALHPEDRARIDAALRRAVEDCASYDEPKRTIWPDGSIHWTASRGRVYCDTAGQPNRMIGVTFDITKWKEAEAALQKNHEELRAFFSQTIDGCFFMMLDEPVRWDGTTDQEAVLDYVFAHQNITQINDAMLAQYGATREQMLKFTPNDFFKHDLAHGRDLWRQLFDTGKIRLESDERKLDGTPMWIEGEYIVLYDADGRIRGHFGIQRDVTERKQMEAERQIHLRFFESMDRVNQAMQGTNDLEQMMRDVLDIVLTIFDCDRAWLLYPCDPVATVWRVPMERTRPEYPGAFTQGIELPTRPELNVISQQLLNADGPVSFGPGSEHPLPEDAAQYDVQSFIAMALYPKVGKPWQFGLHQCSHARIWTTEEERLFQEVGRRLSDVLTSLLAYRDLRESQRRLEEAERIAHVGWWDRDYDADCITLSDEACRIFGLALEDQHRHDLARWHKRWQELIHPEDRPRAAQAAEAALQGGPRYNVEYRVIQPDGEVRIVHSQGDVVWDESGQPQRIFGTMQDITELRQTEGELRASEARFRTFVDHAADAFFLHDERGTILDVNRQACEMLGYTRQELVGISPYDFDVDTDRSFMDEMKTRLDAGEVFVFETRHRRKDGTVLPVEVRVRPFWQDERRVAVSLARDVTDRKQAQEALRASEERYRALYRDNPSMFFTLDSEGVVISVNAFGASQLGYTIEELEGQSVLKVFYEEDHTAVTTQLQRCLQNPGQNHHWQFRKVRKDGSLLWVDEFVRTVKDPNGVVNVLVVCQDITDRKQAEIEQERLLAQIQEQAQQVQNIIDTVPEGVMFLSKDQVITLANPAARQYLNLLVPSHQGQPLTHLGQRPLSELLTSPPKGLWHEITSNGLTFEAIARPVEDSSDNSGWVLVLRDVTQERDIQQRIQQQERLASVGQLAAGIAHDFNNTLAAMTLFPDLILRTVDLPPRAQERLHTIVRQAQRAQDLIQQILDFSRQSVLERQLLDLLPFMKELMRLFERTIPEHIQITLDHDEDDYIIQADPSRIQQAMMNLVVNARDAMPEGGQLRISLKHVQIGEGSPAPLQGMPPGEWVQIQVADTGGGIPQEVLPHVFEPFFTTKDIGQGTGLGLAQVYGIVQQHEGHIDVDTTVGQGTTFTLYLLVPGTGENEGDTPDRGVLQLGQGQRILVVEDDSTTREALLDSLDHLNYEVMAASNGHEALSILAARTAGIDLVLSDAVMPEMGGIALFHTMQEQKLSIPVVLLTGHPLSEEMEKLQMLGLAGWLSKPPGLVSLSNLLAKALSA